ncbi:MAG: aliphatic sulfonate ABC transporter substrate-binding protein [Planctomycetota bacterium]|nr:aliphatic sulfonate ABC transporter substrate-binding protein [Planctomycetota bacterium]
MRLLSHVIFFIALLPLFTGCDKPIAASSSDTPTSSSTAPEIPELRIGYFANVTHAQAVLGVASGDFQAALGDTKLKTKIFNAGPELIEALNAGAIDIGYVGPGPVLSAHANSRGQAVRVIAGSAANGVVVVARKDAGITTLHDLIGKHLATPQYGNTQDVSAKHYVTAVLGQADANNVLPVANSQQAGMMARGQIDAAWVPEPWGARLIDETGAVLIGEEKDLWPDHQFALTVVVTTPKFLADHPSVIGKVLRVHHKWTQQLTENGAAYADQLNAALVALGGKHLPQAVLQSAIKRTVFTDDALPDTFATMAHWSADLKFIKGVPDLTGLFQTQIIGKLAGATTPPTTVP